MTANESTITFREIPGFPGYRIGDDGSVWSCRSRHGRMTATWRPLKGRRSRNGHLAVYLCRGGKRHYRAIHRLVLEAFVGPCPPGMEGCHDPDRDPSNNRLPNLRWDTRRANCADAIRHGTAFMVKGKHLGEANPHAKLTQAQVEQIMEIRTMTGIGARKICRQLGLSARMYGAVKGVICGQSWSHVTGLPPYVRGRLTKVGFEDIQGVGR